MKANIIRDGKVYVLSRSGISKSEAKKTKKNIMEDSFFTPIIIKDSKTGKYGVYRRG
jgi:hypothetical protein